MRRLAEQEPASPALRGELEPRERIDGDGVGRGIRHVAVDDVRCAPLQQGVDPPVEVRKIAAPDWAAQGEPDGSRGSRGHLVV